MVSENMVRWLILIWTFVSSVVSEVYSCGGFVMSPNVPLDYSRIQVKLFTAEGNLKFETECSPTNGYYMIPVYNKGDYSIRLCAPSGWFFEPSSFALKVDGKTDSCTKGEDINFILAAFAVEGVLRSANGSGPPGVTLTLTAENGTLIAENKTDENGAYRFRAPPGNYVVSTANNSTECTELGKVPISITTSPVHVTPDLKISGHLLTVRVLSKKLEVADVSIALFSSSIIKLSYCDYKLAEKDQEEANMDEVLLCKMKTDIEGIARFPCLPPGTYTIYPSFFSDKVHYTFSPKTRTVTMGLAAEKVVFDIRGFSSKGRVLLSEKPVADAEVLVNGKVKERTDENGWYMLDGLQDEEYAITARKEHFRFSSTNIKLSVLETGIPNINAESVEVCVLIDAEKSNNIMSVKFKNRQTNATKSVNINSIGKVCTFLEIGHYTIWVSTENAVVITPERREISLFNGPVMNILFSQFKANMNVNIICTEDCGTLRIEVWKQNVSIESIEGYGPFVFHGISPGSYKLKILDGNQFCWENAEFDIVVERADLNDLVFRQTGYRTTTKLSHPAKAKWSMMGKAQISGLLDIPAGEFFFCIPLPGIYTIEFGACYLFEQPSYEINIPQKVPLVASVTKFMVSASIEMASPSTFHDDFALIVKSLSTEQVFSATSSTANKLMFTFYLSVSDANTSITLIPQSRSHLFEPTSHIFQFTGTCHLDEVTFKADKGVFLEGQVLPVLEDVHIRLQHRADPNIIFKSVTDSGGKFRIGPIRSVADFEIAAEKSGYKFEKTENFGVLHAIKLSQLIIAATDIETGKPLSNVLISLSGAENYRSNNFIDETGKINFVGLQPGEYFLRPILQEYKFEPKSLTLNIDEGEFQTVSLKGHRFAYSVFGKVAYPSGEPVLSVVAEAVSEQCSQLQEEDITDENGEYRIRGLHPKCVYRLVLKAVKGQRMQSYPTHYDVMVNAEDVKGIDFILTHITEQVDVAGQVNFVGIESPPHYLIGLYKSDSLVREVNVTAPSTVFYFDVPTLDSAVYSIRFDTSQGIGGQKLDSAEIFFVANETFKVISLDVHPQRELEVEISGSCYFALPFFFLVGYIFLNHQKASAFMGSTLTQLSSISLPQHNPSSSDDSADTIRKRQKLKKVQ